MEKAEHSRFGALYKKDFLSMFVLIICVFSTLLDFFQLRIGGGSCYGRDGVGMTAGTTVAVEWSGEVAEGRSGGNRDSLLFSKTSFSGPEWISAFLLFPFCYFPHRPEARNVN